jgi:hypothetical protein
MHDGNASLLVLAAFVVALSTLAVVVLRRDNARLRGELAGARRDLNAFRRNWASAPGASSTSSSHASTAPASSEAPAGGRGAPGCGASGGAA